MYSRLIWRHVGYLVICEIRGWYIILIKASILKKRTFDGKSCGVDNK